MTTRALRAIVIGADGVIGSALYSRLSRRGHDVFKTTRRKTKVDSSRSVFFDLAEPQIDADHLPDADVAIICAAMSHFADCRTQPAVARRVNVITPAALARRLVERGTFVVRLSSSVVFDCRIARVHARHPTAPLSAYGRLQAEAEEAILGLGENASVLRLTKIITSDFPLVRNWIAALAKGDSIEAFEDHTICPLPLELAIDAATAVLEFRRGGIFQASGAGDISYADLARYLARRLGLPASRVVAVRATDRGVPENEVTSYTSMDTGRLTAMTGFTPPEPFSVLDDAFDEIITKLSKAQASRA